MAQPATHSTGRGLLAALRELMAAKGSAQQKLDKIVRVIASECAADVCSCYLLRAGEVLELFATVGLKHQAINQTRLRVGEGLVGEVARSGEPLVVPDAPLHPSFAYRPETGEEPFSAFLGVPLHRGGKVRGVLTLQQKEAQLYSPELVETLQTAAMVVAELVAASELVPATELGRAGDPMLQPTRLEGLALNSGLALGEAVLHRPQLITTRLLAEDVNIELQRLTSALTQLDEHIFLLWQQSPAGESRDILQTFRQFAQDKGWHRRLADAIRQGLTAEAATERVRTELNAKLAQALEPVLLDKLADIDDLSYRLLQFLSGVTPNARALPEQAILVAYNMGPAELLDYDVAKIKALIMAEGSATAHVAIVARALNIPVVAQCGAALSSIEAHDTLFVDGNNGLVFVRPSDDILESFTQAMQLAEQRAVDFAQLAALPTCTTDGTTISLQLNCGLLLDFDALAKTGADAVGLYRTEVPFMLRSSLPDLVAQTELYKRALASAGDKPVMFRTLDVGGDKTLPYLPVLGEPNPALGWRALRMGLDRPALLRTQLRAILQAGAGKNIYIMLPMVAELAEFFAARDLLHREQAHLLAKGVAAPKQLQLGVMLEVPSLLWQLDELLRHADFISLGSNDMLQYFFAADRANALTASRYDSLSPSFLRLLKNIVQQCAEAGKPLSVCGEMAGNPIEALALLGLGVRKLSLSPNKYAAIKIMLRKVDLPNLTGFITQLLERSTHSLRGTLSAFAKDNGLL